jgi:hypothetical protein
MKRNLRFLTRTELFAPMLALALILSISLLVAYRLEINFAHHGVYDTYYRQAAAWLSGSISLASKPDWLELVQISGRTFVSFPPIPSLIFAPLVAIFGENLATQPVSLMLALVGFLSSYILCRSNCLPIRHSIAWALTATYAAGFLFLSLVPGPWFEAQLLSFAFTCGGFALIVGSTNLPNRQIGFLLLAMATGCRPFQLIYYIPLAYWCFKEHPSDNPFKSFIVTHLPASLVLIGLAWFNYIRFGSPLEFGHSFLTNFTNREFGQFSWNYVVPNLSRLLIMPQIVEAKLVYPEFDGFNIFLAHPILIVAGAGLIVRRLDRTTQVLFVAACCHAFLFLLHDGMGSWHFGNRYFLDLIPAVLLMISSVGLPFPRWGYLLLILGIVQQVYGTLAVLSTVDPVV